MTDIATAAQSGASATARFQQKARDGAHASTERVNTLVSEMISAAHDIVRRNHLTYPEYDALKAWLIQVGLDGEWPLFLDVFLEHAVEQEVNAERPGSKGTIEGSYYVPGAPSLPAQTTLPMREADTRIAAPREDELGLLSAERAFDGLHRVGDGRQIGTRYPRNTANGRLEAPAP